MGNPPAAPGAIGSEMNNLSVVIPSKTASNFLPCSRAVRVHEPDARIILVNDGITRADLLEADPPEGREEWKFLMVQGASPFIFARNVNLGIAAAGEDDVIVLNDDAILQTPGGFTLLQQTAADHHDFGVIASTTNNVGNRNQYPKSIGLRVDPRMVCFVAVLIPRRTIDQVGLLDEIYTGYGMDDDDYSLRVRNAGLTIGIHDGCFVDHASLTSSFRGPAGAGGNYFPNLEIFKQKWGMDNWGKPNPA